MLGVDWCAKEGWVVVALRDGRYDGVAVYKTFAALLSREADATVVAVDIPIGLPERGPRAADAPARRFVAPRGGSVFPAPPRSVLAAASYETANALSLAVSGKKISIQTYSLRERIFEVEAAIQDHVVEIHPEVSFRAMTGRPLRYPKDTWNGLQERLTALERAAIDLPLDPVADLGKAGIDDVLDAAAAAWSAWRIANGKGATLPVMDPLPPFRRREIIWY